MTDGGVVQGRSIVTVVVGVLALSAAAAGLRGLCVCADEEPEARERVRRDRAADAWLQENVARHASTPAFRPARPLPDAELARRLRVFLKEHAGTRAAKTLQSSEPGEPWVTYRRILRENPPPVSDAPSESHAASIRKLLELPGPTKELFDRFVATVGRAPGMRPGMAAKLEELFDPEELVDLIVPIYARHVDEGAVEALLAFHATPEGRRIAAALPRIQAELAEVVEVWGKGLLERVRDELRQEEAARIPLRAGIHIGKGVLWAGEFAGIPGAGAVHDLRRGDFAPRAGLEMAVVASRRALLVDDETHGVVVADVEFTSLARRARALDVDGDGRCEFVERCGGWSAGNFFTPSSRERNWYALDLLDHAGHVRWSYGGKHEALTLAAGDLDADAALELVVGFSGGHGLHVVDENGDLVQAIEEPKVWHVEIADLDGDQTSEIVCSDADGRLKIRDASGGMIRRLTLPFRVEHFSIAHWPAHESPARILVWPPAGGALLLDGHGDTVHELALPRGVYVHEAWGVPIAFVPGEKPHFALLAHQGPPRPTPRGDVAVGAVLCVFDPEGEVVFLDVQSEAGSALLAVPVSGEDGERLLVGGCDRVWMYGWKQSPASTPPAGPSRTPPSPPDAGRAMRELHVALADAPVRVVRLRVSATEATVQFDTEEAAALEQACTRIAEHPYFTARAKDGSAVVERSGPVCRLRFREDWAEPTALLEASGLSTELIRPFAERVGLFVNRRSDPYRDTDWTRYDTLYQPVAVLTDDRNPDHMTLEKLERFLEELAEGGTYRVTELRWSRPRTTAARPVPPASIGLVDVTIAGWRKIPRRP